MPNLSDLLAENQKDMLKVITANIKETLETQNVEKFDSEGEESFAMPPSTLYNLKRLLRATFR